MDVGTDAVLRDDTELELELELELDKGDASAASAFVNPEMKFVGAEVVDAKSVVEN